MKSNMGDAAVEILSIINKFPQNLKEKIPLNFIENLNSIKSNEYKFYYDSNKKLLDQNIKPETKGYIAYIYKNFLCDENEKRVYEKKYYKYIYDLEIEKSKNFQNKDIFNNSKKTESNVCEKETIIKKENLPVRRNNNWLVNFFCKIKEILFK